MTIQSIAAVAALLGATLATAMVAGLLFSFAHTVMPGLGTLADRDYLTGFRHLDGAIANPWMGVTYLGSPVLTAAALLLRLPDPGPAGPWLVAALTLILATWVITAVVHLPLNAEVQAAADLADAPGLRARFEERWVPWNVVRTVTSTASLAALATALLVSG